MTELKHQSFNADTIIVNDGAGRYLRLPKLTTAQRDTLTAVNGMLIYNSTTNQLNVYQNAAWSVPAVMSNVITITFIIDGSGSAITTGQKGHLEIPFACTITGWTLVADVSGSIVIDVWKDTYTNFPPTVADTIAGTEKPTLASVQKNQDLTLTTWTTAVTAGDILAFNVDSVATVTRIVLSIRVTKT